MNIPAKLSPLNRPEEPQLRRTVIRAPRTGSGMFPGWGVRF